MALHIKSTKSFKIILGVSALLISGMAATFSITGIATLFSGYFLTVALMMGALEFAKIIVASFLARYWSSVSKILRGYFIAALIVLILITSGGIFGYLSDAYQQTKGDYTVVENQINVLTNKKNRFDTNIVSYQAEKEQIDNNINNLIRALQSNKITYTDKSGNLVTTASTAARNLYSKQLTENQDRRNILTQKIDAFTDSSDAIDERIQELESQNIQGELGPLKYIAGIFDTDMDTVVKYFIFLLIFVFDPLAVLLFVSLNTLIRKEQGEKVDSGGTIPTPVPVDVAKEIVTITPVVPVEPVVPAEPVVPPIVATMVKPEAKQSVQTTQVITNTTEPEIKKKVVSDSSEEYVKELISELEKSKTIDNDVDTESTEHEFYHDTETEEKKQPVPVRQGITIKSANYHPPTT